MSDKKICKEFLEKLLDVRIEKTAESTKGTLVKHIHERVIEVKKDKNVEVEFMTLLERDKEKIEE